MGKNYNGDGSPTGIQIFGEQQAPVMQVAEPLNDVQLVALIAAHLYVQFEPDGVAECVRVAKEIVVESIINGNPTKINEAKREREKKAAEVM